MNKELSVEEAIDIIKERGFIKMLQTNSHAAQFIPAIEKLLDAAETLLEIEEQETENTNGIS